MSVTDGLIRCLNTSLTAIFGYQMLGTRLTDPTSIAQARADEQAHRDARDAVLARMAELGIAVPLTDPTSPLPARVVDDQGARLLAVQLEESATRAWRALIAATVGMPAPLDPASRAIGLTQLRASAVRGYSWGSSLTPPRASVSFPGLPS